MTPMLELAPFIRDLALILGIAGIAMIVCQQLRQPIVLGYLIAGFIVGPYTPPHLLVSDISTIKIIAELGVIFLMFSLGIEFSFHKLKRVGAPATITGIIEVFFMLVAGYFVGIMLGWPPMESLFLGSALAISSTTIIIKALTELNLNKRAFAELIFGVLIIEDLFAILLLVGLSTLAATSDHSAASDLLIASLKLFLTVGSWFIIGYFFIPMFFRAWLKKASNEVLIVVSVALCLGLVTLAGAFHYSIALGAFIMGSILAETDEAHRIEHLVTPLRDIFAAVFFVSVGMLIDPLQIWNNLGVVLLITAFTIVAKFLFSFLGAWLSGQRLDTSLQVGLGMAQIGEFSFIIAGLGAALGMISDNFYPLIVAVSLVTSFTTPYLIRFSLNCSAFLRHHKHHDRSLFNNTSDPLSKQLNFNEVSYFKSLTTRFILNAILIAIIFMAVGEVLFPTLQAVFFKPWLLFLFSFLFTYIPASPFIWAALRAGDVPPGAPSKKTALLVRLICLVLCVAEIYILIDAYFAVSRRFFFIALVLVLTWLLSKVLRAFYLRLEAHLKNNLKKA